MKFIDRLDWALCEGVSRRSFLGMLTKLAGAAMLHAPVVGSVFKMSGGGVAGIGGVVAGGIKDKIVRVVGGDGCSTMIRFSSGMNVVDYTCPDIALEGISSNYVVSMPGGTTLESFALRNYPGLEQLAFPTNAGVLKGYSVAERLSELNSAFDVAIKANDFVKITAIQNEMNAIFATGVRIPALQVLHSFQVPAKYEPSLMVGDYTGSPFFAGNSDADFTDDDVMALYRVFNPNASDLEVAADLKMWKKQVSDFKKRSDNYEKKQKTKFCKACSGHKSVVRSNSVTDEIEFVDSDDYDPDRVHNHPSGIAYECKIYKKGGSMRFVDRLDDALSEGKDPYIRTFATPNGTVTSVVLDYEDFVADLESIMPALVEAGADVDALKAHGMFNARYDKRVASLYDKYGVSPDHFIGLVVRGLAGRLSGGTHSSPDRSTTRVMAGSSETEALNKIYDELPGAVQVAIDSAVEGAVKSLVVDGEVRDFRMVNINKLVEQAVATVGRASGSRSKLSKSADQIVKAINDFGTVNRGIITNEILTAYLRRLFALMTHVSLK